jgi:hypothetical protein
MWRKLEQYQSLLFHAEPTMVAAPPILEPILVAFVLPTQNQQAEQFFADQAR